ncbi:MAG: hypothetical protein J6386_00960 [Candidatus Synoicihabitans palmerolidicus]|nr:hypothetical protein [Candidatus Synoicihabitans palmerolidicus]
MRFGFEVKDGLRIEPLALIDLLPREDDGVTWKDWTVTLPDGLSEEEVFRLVIDPGNDAQKDWTFVTAPVFE